MDTSRKILRAYDGSTVTFKALRAYGWNELLNLGYFQLRDLAMLLFGLGYFQKQLVRQSIKLVAPQPGENIVDVGCGYGWTSNQIANSGAQVIGIDLLEKHIEKARQKFGHNPNVTYAVGDATQMLSSATQAALEEESLDKIHCLEAAFHFGHNGRRAFLAEAFSLLKRGGRLVLVDFMWRSNCPEEINELDGERHVRRTWQFEQFEPLADYRTIARECGFQEKQIIDWSPRVINPFQKICNIITLLGQYRIPRFFLSMIRPGVFSMNSQEWRLLAEVLEAHERVSGSTYYVAMVLEKP
ncbi:MAG: class I SAM-dependent methyltransferase [Symploca sp. SIO3C6]|uniref:Class I SAM-dependent methyltransferase n=1 Tax=Symploca sp. SIO1C4 TaxID=2607765 RepID=A0A6B3N758_9CYAN|nr:class I SAM-dependent methyltransferase [Symploca sp. SIO3C6]NER26655.1 class I SAM-dependent methyltransferase [Symploca sp. SIO1C4]NET08068.1 class I SAM-dependent methyltransferase [Symploca sp. SIO2B6]